MNSPSFLVTGTGRSGTLWLSTLLDNGLPCFHEPMAPTGRGFARKALAGKVGKAQIIERYSQMSKKHPREFGEVNSSARFCAAQIRDYLHIPVVGLVRDGRYVVRSSLARDKFKTAEDLPLDWPPLVDSQFKRACYAWSFVYEELRKQGICIYKLEDLNHSYDVVVSLCGDLGISPPPKDKWKSMANRRKNVSIRSKTPPVWSEGKRAAFRKIAGITQASFLYEMDW